MDRHEIIAMLRDSNIGYSLTEHPPAETIEEIDGFGLDGADSIVKNLFLRDDKKKDYLLVVARKDRTVDLKDLQSRLGTRPLSFASESDLLSILGLKKGSVTPFGILNDEANRVRVIADRDLSAFPVIGVHPNENTATLWLSPADLQKIIEAHGSSFVFAEL